MKKRTSALGVTLLEIMLVLAVSGMMIVMSLRYYESATTNVQVNQVLEMIQGITGQADGLAQGTGSYETDVTTKTIGALMSLRTAWGGEASIDEVTSSTYRVSFSKMPVAVCLQVTSRLKANSKYDVSRNSCTTVNTFSYTYSAIA